MKNIFKNIKIDWNEVSKIMDYVFYGALVILLFAAGMSAGLNDWSTSLFVLCFIAMSCLCLYYKRKYKEQKKFVGFAAMNVVENKILKMKVSYYEKHYGEIGEDPASKEHKEDPTPEAENEDPNPPSFEESQGEPQPTCSAANNDGIDMGRIAEGVGSQASE